MKINKLKYFYPEKPELMNIEMPEVDTLAADPNWVAELKYNGSRCMLWIVDGKVEFWDRHGKKLAYNACPDTAMVDTLAKRFPRGVFLFDSELRHNKVTGVRDKLVIWDVFIFMNELLNRWQYDARRAILVERVVDDNGKTLTDDREPVSLINQVTTGFRQVFNDIVATGDDEIEGLVLKDRRGMINISRTAGIKSNWMLKLRKPSGRYKF